MYTLGTASCGSKLATRHLEAHDIIYNSSLNESYVRRHTGGNRPDHLLASKHTRVSDPIRTKPGSQV